MAAITLCRGEGLIIELTDPPSPWLHRGAFMRAQPCNSADDRWSVGSLLAGSVRWCWCKPPPGFCSAALIGGPSLVASRRLLLVANREGRLSEVNLGSGCVLHGAGLAGRCGAAKVKAPGQKVWDRCRLPRGQFGGWSG